MPSSASTVSGVVCETKRLGGPPFSETAWLARGCEPRPTPTSGCSPEHLRRQVDAPRAVARDALRRGAGDLVGHERAAAREHEHGGDGRDEPDGAVAGDDGDEDGDGEERDEARLRVREEEPREEERRSRAAASAIPSFRYHAAVSTIADREHERGGRTGSGRGRAR